MSDLPIVRRDNSVPAVLSDIKLKIGPAVSAIDDLDLTKLPDSVAIDLSNLKTSIVSLETAINLAEGAALVFKDDKIPDSFYERNYWKVISVSLILSILILFPIFFTSILEKGSQLLLPYLAFVILLGGPLSLFLSGKIRQVEDRREAKKKVHILKQNNFVEQERIDEVIKNTKKLENIDAKIPEFRSQEFRCIADYEECIKYFENHASIYKIVCTLSLVTCIAKSLIPFAGKNEKAENNKV